MNWAEIKDQRDSRGDPTPLAMALDALSDNGCNCDEVRFADGPGLCLACRCEVALKDLSEQVADLEAELAEAHRRHA